MKCYNLCLLIYVFNDQSIKKLKFKILTIHIDAQVCVKVYVKTYVKAHVKAHVKVHNINNSVRKGFAFYSIKILIKLINFLFDHLSSIYSLFKKRLYHLQIFI